MRAPRETIFVTNECEAKTKNTKFIEKRKKHKIHIRSFNLWHGILGIIIIIGGGLHVNGNPGVPAEQSARLTNRRAERTTHEGHD